MNPELKKTIICLRISSIIYFLLGFAFLFFFVTLSHEIFPEVNANTAKLIGVFTALVSFIFTVGIGIFVEIVIHGLKKTKYWSWIAAIILTATYIPSLFIILGIIGILGLLNKSVVADFQKSRVRKISVLQ